MCTLRFDPRSCSRNSWVMDVTYCYLTGCSCSSPSETHFEADLIKPKNKKNSNHPKKIQRKSNKIGSVHSIATKQVLALQSYQPKTSLRRVCHYIHQCPRRPNPFKPKCLSTQRSAERCLHRLPKRVRSKERYVLVCVFPLYIPFYDCKLAPKYGWN